MFGLSVTELFLIALSFVMALGFGLTNEPELMNGLRKVGKTILGDRIFSIVDNQLTLCGVGSLVTAISLTLDSEKGTALHVFGLSMFVVAWLFFVLGIRKSKVFDNANHGMLKPLISAAVIGAVLYAVFFFLPSKHTVLIPSSSGSLGTTPAPAPGPGPTLKRPHIHVEGIVATPVTAGQPLNATVVMTNNGDADADVVAGASLFIEEVSNNPAIQRGFESDLFRRNAQKPLKYSNPVMHTIPPQSQQRLPQTQAWNAVWNNLDSNRMYAVYFMGRFRYRSHADHQFDRTSEFCKHFGLDGTTVVKCYVHNVEPN